MTDKEKLNAIRAEVQNYIDAAHKAHTNITEGNFAHLLSFIDSLQEEHVSKDFEAKVKNLWKEINTGHNYSIVDSYNQFYGLCMDIAEWQREQIKEVLLSEVLPYFMHGGEADEVVAKLDEVLCQI